MLASGVAPDDDWYGRPTIEEVDGVLVMIYQSTSAHADPNKLHIKFSNDYGVTWTAQDTNLDGSSNARFAAGVWSGEPWLLKAPNGDLLLFTRINLDEEWGTVGTLMSRSTDGGLSWTDMADVDWGSSVDNSTLWVTDDHFVYDGVIYLAGRISDYPSRPETPTTYLFSSSDNGVTWALVGTISTDTNEVGIEYVGNGRIVALIRRQGNGRTYLAISDNMGVTWEAKQDITSDVLASGRHRIMTMAHLRGEANWWTDTRLVACGFVFVAGGRRNALFFSTDGGEHWTMKYVDQVATDAGYGDIYYNPAANQIVFVSYQGTTSDADMVQYNVTVDWGT